MSIVEAVPVILGRDGRPIRQIKIHRKQAEVLAAEERFRVCPWGRRSGKSELGVLWTLAQTQRYRAAGVKGIAWLIFPQYLHATTAWRKIHKMAPDGWITSVVGNENIPRAIEFGSVRLEFRSAAHPETLVSEGLLFCWIDECGIIKDRVWGESIRPTLMDRASPAFFTGSPKGNNWYKKLYNQGFDMNPKYDHIKSFGKDQKFGYSSHINPFIVQSELSEISADMTEMKFRQEIMAEFLTGEGSVFRRVREQVMTQENKNAWVDAQKIMRSGWKSVGTTCVLGVDVARMKDWTVIVGMDRDFHVTYFDRFNKINWPEQKARIKAAYHKLGRPAVVIDSTHGSVGDPIQQDLVNDGIRAYPFEFTGQSKGPLIESLVLGIEQGTVWMPDEPTLINELELFEGKQSSIGRWSYAAPDTQHDDCVIALALAYHGAQRYGDVGVTFAKR